MSERPDFVRLNSLGLEAANQIVMQATADGSGVGEQPQDSHL
jgi:hypothetical protein